MNTKTALVLKAVAYVAFGVGSVIREIGAVVGILLFAWAESGSSEDDIRRDECDDCYSTGYQQNDWT